MRTELRAAGLRILAGAGAALCLATAPAVAAVQALTRAEAARWALIVEAGDGRGGADLARTLEARYGFQVLHLGSGRATKRGIEESLRELHDRIGPYDELFVHVSLPVFREPHLFYVPEDGDTERPWTLFPARELIRWLGALPTGAALLTYPSCVTDPARNLAEQAKVPRTQVAWLDPDLEELRYGKRAGPLDVLVVCDLESMRLGRGYDEPQPTAWRGPLLAGRIAGLLGGNARDLQAMFGREIAERLSGQDGFDVTFLRVSEASGEGLRFIPSAGSGDEYVRRYLAATEGDELRRVLSDFYSASADHPELEGELVAFLLRVAVDPAAGASGARLERAEALELRALAMEILARMDTRSSRDALIAIASRAGDTAFVRLQAISSLARLRDLGPADLAALRAALADEDASVRETAARSLGVAKDEQSADLLAARVATDSVKKVRLAAIQALTSLDGFRDGGLFVAALADPEAEIRGGAAAALARLGPSEEASAALLERLAGDPDDLVRQSAAFALGRTWSEPQRQVIVDRLSAALARGPESVSAAAASSLGRIGGGRAEAILRQSLAARPQEERVAVALAEALGQVGSPDSVPALQAATASESAALRRAAVAALAAIGGEMALKTVIGRLEDPDPYVRQEAAKGLEGVKLGREIVLRLAKSPSADLRVRAYQALDALSDDEARALLLRGLADESPEVRAIVLERLAEFSDAEVVARLAAALAEGDVLTRQSAAGALGRVPAVDGAAVLRALAKGASDPSSGVRAAVMRALGSRGDPAGLEILVAASKDSSTEVRLGVAEGLGGLVGEPRAVDLLQALAKGDPDHDVREAALEALASRYREGEKAW